MLSIWWWLAKPQRSSMPWRLTSTSKPKIKRLQSHLLTSFSVSGAVFVLCFLPFPYHFFLSFPYVFFLYHMASAAILKHRCAIIYQTLALSQYLDLFDAHSYSIPTRMVSTWCDSWIVLVLCLDILDDTRFSRHGDSTRTFSPCTHECID